MIVLMTSESKEGLNLLGRIAGISFQPQRDLSPSGLTAPSNYGSSTYDAFLNHHSCESFINFGALETWKSWHQRTYN